MVVKPCIKAGTLEKTTDLLVECKFSWERHMSISSPCSYGLNIRINWDLLPRMEASLGERQLRIQNFMECMVTSRQAITVAFSLLCPEGI